MNNKLSYKKVLKEIRIYLIFFLIIILNSCDLGDVERRYIRKGNKIYKKEKFEDADIEYRKALEKKPDLFEGKFNLSDATYKQKKFDETSKLLKDLSKNEKDKQRLGMINHNMGNTHLNKNKIDEAIEAYKESLRKNPTDKETKYNLEYAKWLKKKKEQQDKQGGGQDKKNDQDKNDQSKQDKKDGQDQQNDQNKQNPQDNQEESAENQNQNSEKENQDEQENNAENQKGISKENAERILEAILIDEKEAKEKMDKEKAKKAKLIKRGQKDW